MITVLAGGVGAARFLTGLAQLIKQENLTVIVNTGDDIDLFGLHISPDIDIVTYTLAGIVNDEKGWGIKGDTFNCLNMLKSFGEVVWFNLGDQDFATSILRTFMLKNGAALSQVSAKVSCDLGLKLKILPMTDDKVATYVQIPDEGFVHFEEYLVKRAAKDPVFNVKFVGAEGARPAVGVIDAILTSERVIICPSNPIVSIGAILSIPGVRDALRSTGAKKVAVSPIVAGAPIKGPADKLLNGLGVEVSAFGVAKLYADFLDGFIIDSMDVAERGRIEALGVKVVVGNTLMKDLASKVALAKMTLDL
ncbi:MAG: 2-phospho-L-lactate transferase [Candidatus Bathyarchaeota archaeon]|uniref:2-phospho-L-lactate transferase n=1 Tax=Candidatus Bathycorpusculum sp. TaxID=2994959 RepID=UPI0028277427|nr:2-phospho-L-lactate transferase [Candidatus Termiticorpusculum sp.]MCL2257146.1 2-phospho-L-lactate transferase [Candidatus Termiticorpusculum sp.]MCL2292709.1 2-phospho-L-lactate transferase [Candidatus Termiticorpusculum sp.]